MPMVYSRTQDTFAKKYFPLHPQLIWHLVFGVCASWKKSPPYSRTPETKTYLPYGYCYPVPGYCTVGVG